MITGKAKDLFLKWFKEEKLMTGFEYKPIYTQIFLLCEWFKMQNYCISTKSSYWDNNYSAHVRFKEGDEKIEADSLENAYLQIIKFSIKDYNCRFE